MKAHIYKQAYDYFQHNKPTWIWINHKTQLEGYVKTKCLACKGSGIYFITDTHSIPCGECKTSGYWWVTL
ncbi:hypothetical protein D3C75_487430 [compost metagenome]